MGRATEKRKGYRAVRSRVLQQGDRALVRSLAPPGGQGKLHPYWEEIDGGAVSGVKDVQGFSKPPSSTAQPPAPFQYRYDPPSYTHQRPLQIQTPVAYQQPTHYQR
eukprot:XP_011674110.1 PREDICTED: uncharacterized protein LOC105443021 isoform X1 [Strongylocentrotus purpuratus]